MDRQHGDHLYYSEMSTKVNVLLDMQKMRAYIVAETDCHTSTALPGIQPWPHDGRTLEWIFKNQAKTYSDDK